MTKVNKWLERQRSTKSIQRIFIVNQFHKIRSICQKQKTDIINKVNINSIDRLYIYLNLDIKQDPKDKQDEQETKKGKQEGT